MKRQILLPAVCHPRVADRLKALEHDIDVLLWTPKATARTDGETVTKPQPEAAWMSMDLLLSNQLAAFTDTLVEAGSVQWVQGCLAGTDAPPFQQVMQSGIRLSNSDAPNIGVAEFVMSTMMSIVHGTAQRLETQQDRTWRQVPWDEIGGMRWLLVGFGSIGHEVAKRARPFGVEIVGVRRTAVDDPAADRMATMDKLHAELANADAVILACPLTDDTRGLADADFFAAMKPGAILMNVARGGVVNNDDLLAALDTGTPSTAALDVFDTEPLPDTDPFWEHPSIYMTSHLAGAGRGFGPRGDALFIEHLDSYLSGRPLRLEVTPPK